MKYLKKFENHTQYETYINGNDKVLPNVSLCAQENEVHYNPIVPPQPIAPVGKVQIFANPQCTEYADGQSDTIYVRLNQDFGFGDDSHWGNVAQPRTNLDVYTPTTENPQDNYSIRCWLDWISSETDEPFVSGQVVEINNTNFMAVNNPTVIFE